MPTYIALLRGINVAGQKKIKMIDLRNLLSKRGLQDVQTYVQSGNVVFSSDENSTTKLEQLITESIKEKYGWDVPVLVLAPGELIDARENHPFPKDNTKLLYFTFLSERPEKEQIEDLKAVDYQAEGLHLEGRTAFLYFPNGRGRATLSNNLLERKLNVSATTRNWNTVSKLIEMSD